MTFEDEPTRELPSALRTLTDLEPFHPEGPLELPPVSRPISIPAFSHDVVAPPRGGSWGARFLHEPLAVIVGAALLASFVLAGTLGVAVGRVSASGHAAVASVRAPRIAVVLAAHEAITEPPMTAPTKLVATPPPPPQPTRAKSARVPAPAPSPAHRPGFQRPSNLPFPAAAPRR